MDTRSTHSDTAVARQPEQWKVRKVALAGLLGTTLEQYDSAGSSPRCSAAGSHR